MKCIICSAPYIKGKQKLDLSEHYKYVGESLKNYPGKPPKELIAHLNRLHYSLYPKKAG